MNAFSRARRARPNAPDPDSNPDRDQDLDLGPNSRPAPASSAILEASPKLPAHLLRLWMVAGALLALGLALGFGASRVGAIGAAGASGAVDVLSRARLAGAVGAMLAAGALLGAMRLLQPLGSSGSSNSSPGGWLPVASAALGVRALWLGLGALEANAKARPILIGLSLLAFALEFGAALLFATRGSSDRGLDSAQDRSGRNTASERLKTGGRLLAAWDGLAIGMGALVVMWWAWRVPLMLRSLPTRPLSGSGMPGLVDFGLGVGVLALLLGLAISKVLSSRARRRSKGSRHSIAWLPMLARLLAISGALGLCVQQARWLNAGVRGGVGAPDAFLLCVSPLALAAGLMLWHAHDALPEKVARAPWEVDADEGGVPGLESWALLVACLGALAMASRLGAAPTRAAALDARAWSLWWAPLLVASAALRLSWPRRGGGGSSWESRREVAELKGVVARRTHQLATLHSMTADLSDTLSCERILSTAVERALLALDARCAAVWLNLDASELSLDDRPMDTSGAGGGVARTVPVAVFVWREMERTGTERRALDNLSLEDDDEMSSGRRTQKIGGSGGAVGGVAVADKRWSMALARGHQHQDARRVLSQMHRLLEFNGLERFAGLARGEASALDIGPADVGLGTITVQAPGAITINAGGPHGPQLRQGAIAPRSPVQGATASMVEENDRLMQELEQVLEHSHMAAIRSKGQILGALGTWRDGPPLDEAERSLVAALALEVGAVLQNVQLYQETSRLADRDSLTDLLNHRAIQSQLNAILSRTQRAEGNFAVVMMDLNNFKFFNDTYGHPEGDRVLRTVARCLREACRAGDIIGRFGGDEFIALLIDTDVEGTLHACQRIAERVQEEGYQQRGDARRIPITLSFGAALFPQDGTTALDLLTVADSQLYEAKRSGGGGGINITRQGDDEDELRKLKEAGTGGSFGVLDALVTAIDNKDHYTRRHSEDVARWASLMARQLAFSTETQRAVRIAGLLHDVGKIAVPDSILRKPGRLGDDEFQIMQQHPVFGALIVKDVPNLPEVLGGIKHHHERFDGKGYPEKLRGEEIPLLGRLLAVPDCFSAMTTDRPYRKALSWAEAMDEIEKGKGTQFDPVMADAFLEAMARIVSGEPDEPTEAEQLPQPEMASSGQADGKTGAAAVARSMADPDARVVSPEEDEPQFQPRSVADAEK